MYDKKEISKDLSWCMKKYVAPFLSTNGFIHSQKTSIFYEFRYKNNSKKIINYELNSFFTGLVIAVSRGKDSMTSFQLTDFFEGPESCCSIVRMADWYFDNRLQLLGLLERHSELLMEWVFDWIIEKIDVDIVKKHEEWSVKLEKGGEIRAKARKTVDEWSKTRFYPQNWRWEE